MGLRKKKTHWLVLNKQNLCFEESLTCELAEADKKKQENSISFIAFFIQPVRFQCVKTYFLVISKINTMLLVFNKPFQCF